MSAPSTGSSRRLQLAEHIPATRVSWPIAVAGFPTARRRHPRVSLHCTREGLGLALVRAEGCAQPHTTRAHRRGHEVHGHRVRRFVEGASGQPKGCSSTSEANARQARLSSRSATLFGWPTRDRLGEARRTVDLRAVLLSACFARTASSASEVPDRERVGRLVPVALCPNFPWQARRGLRPDGSLPWSSKTVPKRTQQAAPRNRKQPLAGQRGPVEQMVQGAWLNPSHEGLIGSAISVCASIGKRTRST
jgi:hypothetical protein